MDSEKLPSSKLILQKDYFLKVEQIKQIRPTIFRNPTQEEFNFTPINLEGKVEILENNWKYKLNAENGQNILRTKIISGYDESKLKYQALEGTGHFTAHTFVTLTDNDYLPISFFTFYFYTRSKELAANNSFATFEDFPQFRQEVDYVNDRNNIIQNYSIENSIVFIDGPLIGGNITKYSLDLIEELTKKGVIPIFIVKNSDSNLVVDNFRELSGKFNSDLHWANCLLSEGERTSLFQYVDQTNSSNAKIFFYIKTIAHSSPQRIEFSPITFEGNKKQLPDIFDLIYYLYLVNGDAKNNQLRPIVISEKYSREIVRIIDTYQYMVNSGISPIMNQSRFGGG
jgi:hypothetical protein